jgi:hypothetical protein
MGRLTLPGFHRGRTARAAPRRCLALLLEIYGQPVPETAWLLDRHLRRGRLPFRDPDHHDRVVTVDVSVAACAFGSSFGDTYRYLHYLHASGQLTMDEHGTVELPPPLEH